MWRYYPELLDRTVPRYTSYPTAAEFHAVDAEFHAAGFDLLRPDDLVSLYLHIPFCEKICWYCGCNTGAANRASRLSGYLDALHAEIETVAARLHRDTPFSQIAFGGGSPNAIAPVDFVRLLDHVLLAFDAYGARLSVELDPRALTPEWIDVLGRAGVTHASMGVQTFDPAIQAAIGRVQPLEDVRTGVKALRRAGVTSLNFDLMYGLPGQDLAQLDQTLEETMAMRPDRIALFGYAHLPSMLPRQRKIDGDSLPGAELRFAMAQRGYELLCRAGYEPVGFDHFALPGDDLACAAREGRLHRNFQGFTDDAASALIGLGASAISAFPDRFVQNMKSSGQYRSFAGAGHLPGARGVIRTSEDRRSGRMIESILCDGHVSAKPGEIPTEALQTLDSLQTAGLIEWDGHRLSIREEGRPYARYISSLFDRHRQSGRGTFSNAV